MTAKTEPGGPEHRAAPSGGHGIIEASGLVRLVLHETRTPLNAIRGFSELLLAGAGGPLSAEALDYVQQVARAGRGLELALQHLQDLVALRSQPVARPRLVDIGAALNLGARVVADGPRDGPFVMGDPEAWTRIAELCRAYLTVGEGRSRYLTAGFVEGDGALAWSLRRSEPAPADGTGLLGVELARHLAAREGSELEVVSADEVRVVWSATRILQPSALRGGGRMVAPARPEGEGP